MLSDLGTNAVDIEVHVDAIGDSRLVGVLHDKVLVEKADGLLARRRGQPDDERVEVVEHLAPHPIDRAVTLVDDDYVEKLRGYCIVIGYLDRGRWLDVEPCALIDLLVKIRFAF